jgi:carboxyl-terminal processing protease
MYNIMSKYRMFRLAAILQVLLLGLFIEPVFAKDKASEPEEKHPNSYYFRQIQDVFQRIEKTYIQDPNRQEMTNEAINGMLKSLDPYSGYFADEDFDFFVDQTDGEFGGIGVEIIPDSGAIKVITPIDDLPAYVAGVRAGDYIVGVNGQLVSTMGFNKSVQEMRGKPGTKLNLLVVKEEGNKTEEIELKREIVKIKPVKYEIEEEEFGGVGYIRIVAFNHQTSPDIKNAVISIEKKLKSKNKTLKGIILDLRSNPGGLFDEAIAVCEYFIDHGVIVSVKGRDSKDDNVTSAGRFVAKAPKVPMVVLVNSGSASAAEIVAGALQDHKRAVIVGTTTYGKGLVQVFTQIGNRKAVKLTTAKYYTPSGRSINAKGIVPDIYIENAKVEFSEKDDKEKSFTSSSIKSYLKKYNSEEKNEEISETKDYEMSKKYKEDYQYARAYDLIRGLIINHSNK